MAASSVSPANGAASFLTIPIELRLNIFSYVFGGNAIELEKVRGQPRMRPKRWQTEHQALCLSRQLRDEALGRFRIDLELSEIVHTAPTGYAMSLSLVSGEEL
ncbi:hypothetical protein H2198_000022 [Neophaeococcomyces mojaviensis]|uniref:Uncharacterized protein n=1 Tax=Neophaeococcomyces mojaviensis TaxID=3383035 RepID=A0ACC3AKP9_9EURO|nr:hypothetical protein H2198_000022 [Knufia sp. JES_112]